MEFKRGEKFVQPTTTPTPAADSKIFRRGENAQIPQEPKEPLKQDLGIVRGSKIQEEKKESMVFQRATKPVTTEIKEEKKTAPKELTPAETISKGNMINIIMRPKVSETPSTGNSNMIQRGTAAAAVKKDEKPAASVSASGGFAKGAALQKPVAEEKNVNTDGKDGGWRKK